MTAPAQEPEGAPVATILAALVAALLTREAAATLLALLGRLAGISVEALRFMFRSSSGMYAATRMEASSGTWTEPEIQQYDQNVHRRAAYLVNASRRVSKGWIEGGLEGLRAAYERELRWWDQHREAARKRMRVAKEIGRLMENTSAVQLGWHARMDERTSAECRAAHGRNFNPNRIPPIGYPGTVHPHCRCRAGIPFATTKRVEAIRPDHGRRAS